MNDSFETMLRQLLREKLMRGYPLHGEALEVVLDALMAYEKRLSAKADSASKAAQS